MDIQQPCPCVYERDKDQIIELVRTYRLATGVAIYPTTWRVRLLLTSRVWNPEQDTRIWEAASGQMAAFAMLWRRRETSPYLALERFAHPYFTASDLAESMLAWGSQRAEAIAVAQAIPLTVYAADFGPPLRLESRYDRYNFTPLVPDPDGQGLYFGRSLRGGLPEPPLPPGYSIRPVQGQTEQADYQAIYGFAAVNPQHQQELFDSDEYSHLVAVTPGGGLAAYCESSIDRAEWQASGQRIGWIDYIETRQEHQGRGLGQAVLWAGLKRLQEWGAETAMLVTESTNAAAMGLYHKTGFERLDVREPARYTFFIAGIS